MRKFFDPGRRLRKHGETYSIYLLLLQSNPKFLEGSFTRLILVRAGHYDNIAISRLSDPFSNSFQGPMPQIDAYSLDYNIRHRLILRSRYHLAVSISFLKQKLLL